MRSRFRCLLLDAGPGRLEAVGDVLAAVGVDVERMPLAAAIDRPPAEATVILADAKDPAAVDLLRQVVPPAWLRERALVVLARAGDAATISRAVVVAGADDVVCTPLDEHELLERLDFAATLARTRAEAEARDTILTAFRGGRAPSVPPHERGNPTTGARVLMVGTPGPLQTQLVAALEGAALAYARDEALPAALAAATPFDLVVRTAAAP